MTWIRVHGPDADPENKLRAKRNQDIMKSEKFRDACVRAGIPVTKRQASRWHHKRGLAYRNRYG
jgi:hypothetical protein